MNLFYNDFNKRFLSAPPRPATPRKMTDAQVIHEMAQIWLDSGGEADGLDDEYVKQLREEIAKMETTPLDNMPWEQASGS